MAADADGDFVVAWQRRRQDGSVLRRLRSPLLERGLALASEFQVNTYTTGDQIDPSVAADGQADFVIAWHGSSQDGSSYGIFAQRFVAAVAHMDIDGNGAVEPLTDGLLVLRYLFGFRGATLITGAVGGGCTRCDAPAIEGYIAGVAPD